MASAVTFHSISTSFLLRLGLIVVAVLPAWTCRLLVRFLLRHLARVVCAHRYHARRVLLHEVLLRDLLTIELFVIAFNELHALEELDVVVEVEHLIRNVVVAARVKAHQRALLPVFLEVVLVHPFAREVLL